MTVIQKSLKFISIHGMHLSRNFRHQSGEHQAWARLPTRPILPCNMIQHFSSESSCQEIREEQLKDVKEVLMETLKKDHEVRDNVQSHLVMTCWFCFSLTVGPVADLEARGQGALQVRQLGRDCGDT